MTKHQTADRKNIDVKDLPLFAAQYRYYLENINSSSTTFNGDTQTLLWTETRRRQQEELQYTTPSMLMFADYKVRERFVNSLKWVS